MNIELIILLKKKRKKKKRERENFIERKTGQKYTKLHKGKRSPDNIIIIYKQSNQASIIKPKKEKYHLHAKS